MTRTAEASASPAPPAGAQAIAALTRLAHAEHALRQHKGAPAGEAYDRKIAEWRSAYNAAMRLGRSLAPKGDHDASDEG